MLFNEPIIKKQEKKNVQNHKFHGIDASLYYQYIASPICDRIVKHIPINIA